MIILDEKQIRKVREKVNNALIDDLFKTCNEIGIDDENLSTILQCGMKRINDLRKHRDFIYAYEVQLIFDFIQYLSEKDDEKWQVKNEKEDNTKA